MKSVSFEQYGHWDDSVEWPYWGRFSGTRFKKKEDAEKHIRDEIERQKKVREKREEDAKRHAEWEAANPPYIYPPEE